MPKFTEPKLTPKQKPGKGESAQFAYRILRNEIISLRLAPGSDFEESEIIQRLGISRTPLREAVVRLSGEGLIRLLPNRGARVAPMEWTDIREHLEAFDLMQRVTTRWAAARRSLQQLDRIAQARDVFRDAAEKKEIETLADLNWDFHAEIGRSCGNSRVEQFYLRQLTENLRISQMAMVYSFYDSHADYARHLGKILEEHDALVDAIRENDCDRADALAASHTGLARKRVIEVLAREPSKEIRMDLRDTETIKDHGNV